MHGLVKAGRLDDAVAELEGLSAFHAKAMLAPVVVMGLRQAGRMREAGELARDGLAAGSLEGRDRAGLVRVAIEAAARQDDWARVELLAREELGRLALQDAAAVGEHLDDYTWVRLEALRRLRRHVDAGELLKTSGIQLREIQHLVTWAQITGHDGFTPEDVELLLQSLDDLQPDAELTGQLLGLTFGSFTVADAARRNAAKVAARAAAEADGEPFDESDDEDEDLPDEAVLATPEGRAGRALYEAIDRHRAEYGELPGLIAHTLEDGEEGVAKFIDQLTASMRTQSEALDKVIRLVHGGQPLGLLAAVARRPYSRAIVGRVLGYLPAVSTDEALFDVEAQDAASAVGKPVVVEASTLHIVDRLGKPALTGHFLELLLSERGRDDITAGLLACRADLASSGHMGIDRLHGGPTMSTGPDPDALLLIVRAEALEALAGLCRVVPVDADRYAKLSDAGAVEAGDIEGEAAEDVDAVDPELTTTQTAQMFGPWLDAIELAVEAGVSLWSDDLGLRLAARARGVPTFSTAALLEALIDAEKLSSSEVPQLRAALLRAGVADLDMADEELHVMVDEAAVVRDADPAAARELITAVGMKLSRPSYAQNRGESLLTDARALITAAGAYEQGWAETMVYQALTGLARVGLAALEVLRSAISLSLGGTPFIDAERTARYLELGRQVVLLHDGDDPVSSFSDLLREVFEKLGDSDAFASQVLELLLPQAKEK